MEAPTFEDLDPTFEAFALGLRRTASPSGRLAAERAAAEVLGSGWQVAPIGSGGLEFEVTHPDRSLSTSEAWDAAYRMRTRPDVAYAEPLFAVAVYEDPARLKPPEGGPFEAAESVVTHLPLSEHPEWGLEMIRVTEAWERFFGGDPDRAGAGVVVGHPDTGYGEHPEILDALLVEKGYDFVRDDPDPRDELEKALLVLLDNPSHGTQTASVIVSRRGPQQSYVDDDGNPEDPAELAVSGVAPGARLIPIRTSRTVALTSMRGLVKAIHHAVDQGAHVISISMGGVPSRSLKRAVRYAERNGVIVCAAAGNQVRFVVWPAGYEEVVAAAACNAEKQPWKGSSRGSRVTVTAPGESVWRAHVVRDSSDEIRIVPHVGRGSGTSYAVAHVAGLAALWLSHHGRDELASGYGVHRIPSLFRETLRRCCVACPGLGKGFGAGLVDAVKLLETPLPQPSAFEGAPPVAAVDGEGAREGLPDDPEADAEPPNRLLQALLDVDAPAGPFEADEGPRRLNVSLSRVLETSPEEVDERLEEIGDELIFHLMTDVEAFDALRASMEQPAGLEASGAGPAVVKARLRSHPLSGPLRSLVGSV